MRERDAGDGLDLDGPGPAPSDADPAPSGGEAAPWRTRADVVEFLRRLVHDAGILAPRSTVEAVVADLLADVAERDVARRLTRACGRLGVRLRPLRSDVGAAVASSEPRRPVVLVGRRRGALELLSIFGSGERPLVSADVLTERELRTVESSPGHVAGRLRLEEVRIVAAFRAESVTGEEPREENAPEPTSLRRLWRFVSPDRTEILIVAWAAVGLGILTLSTPIAVQSLVNFVAFGGLMQPLFVVGLLLLSFLAFAGAVRVFKLYVVEILQRRVFVRVVMALAARLPRVRTERWDRGHGPEVVNRFFDVLTVQKAGSSLLISGLDAVLQSGIGLVVLGFYHPLLLLFDVVLIASILFIVFGLGRGGVASARVESKAKYAVAAALEDVARIPMTYKLFGGPDYASARLAELCSHYIGTRRAHYSVVMRQIIGAVSLYAVASTALLTLGGFLVIKGQLTLGQLVAAELIVSLALVTFVKFGKEFETFYDLLAGVDKLGVLFDLPLEEDGDEPYLAGRGGAALECRGVTYAGKSTTAIGKVDLRIRANERVVVRGARGSGKSTLADLLAGLRTPDSGIVLVDGVDIRGVLKATLRSNLAV
ncbi:MAG: ATP-binding cassette domain-containing protein, partial [Planctomycetota bacterium JB042]